MGYLPSFQDLIEINPTLIRDILSIILGGENNNITALEERYKEEIEEKIIYSSSAPEGKRAKGIVEIKGGRGKNNNTSFNKIRIERDEIERVTVSIYYKEIKVDVGDFASQGDVMTFLLSHKYNIIEGEINNFINNNINKREYREGENRIKTCY